MTPHFEVEKGPKELKGVPWYPHVPDSENAKDCHSAMQKLANENGASFKEVKDEKGKPCKNLPNKYEPKK